MKIANEGAGRSTGKKTRRDYDEDVQMGPSPTTLCQGVQDSVLRQLSSLAPGLRFTILSWEK